MENSLWLEELCGECVNSSNSQLLHIGRTCLKMCQMLCDTTPTIQVLVFTAPDRITQNVGADNAQKVVLTDRLLKSFLFISLLISVSCSTDVTGNVNVYAV